MSTTVGQILLKNVIPQDLHYFLDKPLDKKNIEALFKELVIKHPDQYSKIASEIARFGFETSTQSGSSVSLDDLKSPVDKDKRFDELEKEIASIKKKGLSSDKEKDEILDKYFEFTDTMDRDIVSEGLKHNKTLAKIIKAGARGSHAQYRATVAMPGLVLNSKEQPLLDFPVRHSFAEGLSLPEYLTTSYGARQGEISKKLATSQSGFYAKQMTRATMTEQICEYDCGTNNGVSFPTSDNDSIGAFLAKSVSDYNRNNEITSEMLATLQSKKIEHILVRSPITCQSSRHFHPGALCQLCVGIRETGLPPLGSHVGLVASMAQSEPLSQGALSRKHCLYEDTLVKMADLSEKKIKDINVGDLVIGADLNGIAATTRVTDVIYKGQQECNKYTYRVGAKTEFISVIATPNHVCLANIQVSGQKDEIHNHSMRLRKIGEKRHDWSLVFPTRFEEPTNLKNEPYAWLLGLLLGDGCTRSIEFQNLTYFDPSLIRDIEETLTGLNLHALARPSKPKEFRISQSLASQLKSERDEKTGAFIPGLRSPLKKKLTDYGMIGKYAHEKTIPADFKNWSKNSLAELLGGLFSADGSVYISKDNYNERINFSIGLTSKEMLLQVKEILFWKFGIVSKVNLASKAGQPIRGVTYKGKNDYVSKHDLWKIQIADTYNLNKFLKEIPFVGIKKETIKNCLDQHAKENTVNFYRCKRSNIEDAGLLPCYDLTVECKDNLFVLANGAIVHNSSGTATARTGGFELVNQLANIPKNFPDAALIADKEGKITSIKKADVGGHYITIGDKEHYVNPGFNILTKLNDEVEPGDVISEGIIDPSEIVKHKGIGEGRRHYAMAMHKAFKDSGLTTNRRNFEVTSKNAINHVQITDPEGLGDYLTGQIVPYQAIEKTYTPRADSKLLRIDKAKGQYLEEPTLHYSIGTPISKSVIANLKNNNIESINVNSEKPGFDPIMVRLLDVPEHEPDLMFNLYSTYLDKKLKNAVATGKGSSSDLKGPAPIAGLAYAKGFGSGNF